MNGNGYLRTKLGAVTLMSVMSISVVACGGASGSSSAPHVGSAVENSTTSEPLSAATSSVVPATTTTTSPPVSTAAAPVVTAAPTTPPPVVTAAPDPHGVGIETGCVRSDIDFDAVRVAAGVTQPEVGRIPPSTCNVLVYATGTDGRIAWLEVGIGDIFGWSAQSNFVQTSFAPAPVSIPAGVAVATTLPAAVAPVVGGATLDFAAQTVFGFGVGYVSFDQVVNTVSAQLGPVTSDTGWLPEIPADPDDGCSGSPPTRILSWGDLTITISQPHQPGPSAALSQYLELWYVGDPTVSNVLGRNVSGAPTGVHTADGIGIGSTMKSVNAAYGAEFQFSGTSIGSQLVYGHVNETTAMAVALLAVNDHITGIGTLLIAC
jgi:hypothetical protein